MDNGRLDALLYLASEYMVREEIKLYNEADDDVILSARYSRKMKRFIGRVKRQEIFSEWEGVIRTFKRVSVAVMLICTVGLGCVLGIKATREALWKVLFTKHDKYITVTFVPESMPNTEVSANNAEALSEAAETTVATPAAPTEILDYREPAECLVGYDRYEILRSFASYFIEYEKDDILITYSQYIIGEYATYMNNHDTVVRDIEINGYHGIGGEYTIQGIDYCSIIWRDDEYQYDLAGNLPFEELLKIAESVKSVD